MQIIWDAIIHCELMLCFSPVCFNMIEEAYMTKCGHSFWYVSILCVVGRLMAELITLIDRCNIILHSFPHLDD